MGKAPNVLWMVQCYAMPSQTEEIHMFNQCVDNSRESDRDAACSSPALCWVVQASAWKSLLARKIRFSSGLLNWISSVGAGNVESEVLHLLVLHIDDYCLRGSLGTKHLNLRNVQIFTPQFSPLESWKVTSEFTWHSCRERQETGPQP